MTHVSQVVVAYLKVDFAKLQQFQLVQVAVETDGAKDFGPSLVWSEGCRTFALQVESDLFVPSGKRDEKRRSSLSVSDVQMDRLLCQVLHDVQTIESKGGNMKSSATKVINFVKVCVLLVCDCLQHI